MKEKIRGFEVVKPEHRKHSDIEIKLPLRATRTSAGYDFFCPIDVDIPPQGKATFDTDIKAYMQPGEMLLLVPRSSAGIKHDLMLGNTVAIGDSDFFENEDNDGNYKICLRNLKPAIGIHEEEYATDRSVAAVSFLPIYIEDLREENTVHLKAGDRVVQGIFIQTLPADNGNSDVERTGGVGSTGG